MASLTSITMLNKGDSTDVVNTLTASDTFTYLGTGSKQLMVVENNTGSTLSGISVVGSGAGSITFQGGGTVDFSAGYSFDLDDGERKIIKLLAIDNYLTTGADSCTITGGTGCTCSIFNM